MSPRPPTTRQGHVLFVIWTHFETWGRPPTVRELGIALGAISTNAVNCHLNALVTKELIAREPKLARSIRVTPRGARCLNAMAEAP